VVAFVGGYLIYSAIRQLGPLRLDAEEEYEGADLTIHKVSSSPDRESHW
jgi:Amt family ammonium transporter